MIEIINIDSLMKFNIYNWKFNRPVNQSRIPPIVEYIQKHKCIEGIIYLAKQCDSYYCYDGIHRYSGIKQIVKQQNEYMDLLGTHDILQINVVIDIMPYDEDKIHERFININSSLPVPSIYTDSERKLDRIHITEKLYKYIHTKYSLFVKASRKTNIPNTNSTQFAEKFNNILDTECTYNIEYWKETFHNFNEFMKSRRIKTKLSRHDNIEYAVLKLSCKQEHKCAENDFYCFAATNWEDYFVHYLEQIKIK